MQMQIDENLLWILDGTSKNTWDEEENNKRIAFVHSLGQKCDSVGWSDLDLADSRSDEILESIKSFCEENGWKARGYYSRKYHITDSQWYRLSGENFKDSECSETFEFLKDQNGNIFRLYQIKAYMLLGNKPKQTFYEHCVSEDFMNACAERNLGGLKYCWIKDVGKYKGVQYFAIAPEVKIPRIMCDENLHYKVNSSVQLKRLPVYNRIQELGGSLPKISQIFKELDIRLDSCYLNTDMPDTLFATGYLSPSFSFIGVNDVLIRHDAVEELLSCKVITEKQIQPVYITDLPIPGYRLKKTDEKPFPGDDILESRLDAYRHLISKDRPQRSITEKEAIRILRNAKKQRNEDFKSALSKKQRESLAGTEYAALVPYYAICEAGYLSDEYKLLSYKESLSLSKEVVADLEKEETKGFSAKGIVIAVCPDGDKVMLITSNEVIRISHEAPEIIGQWASLADFFSEVIS